MPTKKKATRKPRAKKPTRRRIPAVPTVAESFGDACYVSDVDQDRYTSAVSVMLMAGACMAAGGLLLVGLYVGGILR